MASNERDYTIANRVARWSNVKNAHDVTPRQIRMSGLALVLGGLMAFGLFVTLRLDLVMRRFAVSLVPALGLAGLWFIADANALASGRRHHQTAIAVALLVVAFILGFLFVS
ncbi:MAG: hypothetical protein R3B13_12110 [Polyangiaceae bacterium]